MLGKNQKKFSHNLEFLSYGILILNMSHLASSSLQELQSFLKRLQVGINKKAKLDFIAIEVKREVYEIILAIIELRREVEETNCVEIEVKEEVEIPTTFGIK